MKKITTVALLSILLFIVVNPTSSNAAMVGYYDLERVCWGSEVGIKSEGEFKNNYEKMKTKIKETEDDLRKRKNYFEEQKNLGRDTKELEADYRIRFQAYQKLVSDSNSELSSSSKELKGLIASKVLLIVDRIKKRENYSLILEANDPNLKNYPNSINLSLRVIEELNKENYKDRITPSTLLPSKEKQITVSGSGFAVSKDGYLLTCYHVVINSDHISVIFSDGKPIPARLIKYSRNNDLALIKIDKKTPHYLELSESGKINMGEHVFTIGFPVVEVLGVEPKYIEGTISSLSGIQDEASFMQISVPVQPGNSGGPLINTDGKVVGIITSRAADIPFFKTAGALPQNVNWAVKADIAKSLFKNPSPTKQKKSDKNLITENTKKAVYLIIVTKSE